MASNDGIGNSVPVVDNVWADEHVNEDELDMEELIRIEEAAGASGIDSGSPTRYSSQTIRQKKGRKLVTTMRTSSSTSTISSSSTSPPPSLPLIHTYEKSDFADIGESMKIISSKATSSPNIGSNGSLRAGGGYPSVGLYQGLGRLQAFSAIAFGAFGLIHLVPPMLASVGGVELANKALIWGRVYYQTYGVEQVFVYGSLAVHIGTGLCRAIVRFVWKSKSYYAATRPVTDSEYADRPASSKRTTSITKSGAATMTTTTTTTITTSSSSGTKTSSTSSTSTSSNGSESGMAPGLFPYHRLIGWILTPLVLGHMNTLRLTPIKVLGDSSMLDYSFVTYLHRMNRPAPYLLLICFMTYHMIGGGPVAFNMVLPKGSGSRIKTQELIRSKKSRAVATGVVSTIALVGAFKIMNAQGAIPMAKLYRAMLGYSPTTQR
ncbi:hypothetical protein BGX27_010758 [Mortierella sp. AM989]|nr:hypothetical protein BGX27_010758 [Mortierella sp. AM989]